MEYQQSQAYIMGMISFVLVMLAAVFRNQRFGFLLLALITVSITIFIMFMLMLSYSY